MSHLKAHASCTAITLQPLDPVEVHTDHGEYDGVRILCIEPAVSEGRYLEQFGSELLQVQRGTGQSVCGECSFNDGYHTGTVFCILHTRPCPDSPQAGCQAAARNMTVVVYLNSPFHPAQLDDLRNQLDQAIGRALGPGLDSEAWFSSPENPEQNGAGLIVVTPERPPPGTEACRAIKLCAEAARCAFAYAVTRTGFVER
ncbi:MAG: hypothetical protein WD049_04780 [Candidatus Paceibacterota bacterium]